MPREAQIIYVEVAYATADEQIILPLHAGAGITVGEAIRRSGIQTRFPDIDLGRQKVGIFSHPVALTQPLRHNDRVEIYRALNSDPKELRRRHAGQDDAGGSGPISPRG